MHQLPFFFVPCVTKGIVVRRRLRFVLRVMLLLTSFYRCGQLSGRDIDGGKLTTAAGRLAAAEPALKDPALEVRFHAALHLAEAGHVEGVQTLITLLGELRREQAIDVENVLIGAAGELGPKIRLSDNGSTPRKLQSAWAQWWRQLDDSHLLAELKKHVVPNLRFEQLQVLIQTLGDKSFAVRKKAEENLIRLGPPILPLLIQSSQNPDGEVRRRVGHCIAILEAEKKTFVLLTSSITRLIALRRPSAAESILECMPFLKGESVDYLQFALDAAAYANGKVRPAIVHSLQDKKAARRAAAAQALCAGPWASYAQAIRRLLKDPDGAVRLQTALALASAGDASAVPVLIALAAELSPEQGAKAVEYLNRLAGDKGPKNMSEGKAYRKKRSAAWSAWWEAEKGRTRLVDYVGETRRKCLQLGEGYRGYTLLVQRESGVVTELDAHGEQRWSLLGLNDPCDAQVLKGRRVLVVEGNGRVTERDFHGKVLWETNAGPGAVSAQRIRNGNTLIVCTDQVFEVNCVGNEVLRIKRKKDANIDAVGMLGGAGQIHVFNGIEAAHKLANGRIVMYEDGGLTWLDERGRRLKSYPLFVESDGCHEILDDGHALIACGGIGNVVEFNADAKEVHRFSRKGACHAYRLPNGHIFVLVDGVKQVELDEKWRPIKKSDLSTPALRVKGR